MRLRALVENLRFKYGPSLAGYLMKLSTIRATYRVHLNGPLSILIDNTVLDHAVTHETAWIPTGKKIWGDSEIETGYAARIAVHSVDSNSREYKSIQFLPGLVSLAQRGLLNIYTSAELRAEQFHQPIGRFRGYGILDYRILSSIRIKSIDGYVFPTMGSIGMDFPSGREQQLQRLKQKEISYGEYASLVKALGRRHSQDAWHIYTAEKYGMFCFLTMDFDLFKPLWAQRNTRRIKQLTTKIMTPEQLGEKIGLYPVPPHIFSYHNASFPVRADLAWPGGRRMGSGRRTDER